MKLENNTALTTYEDEDGVEWELKLHFNYTRPTAPEYQDGLMVYPGDQESVEIDQIDRLESILVPGVGDTGEGWVLWDEVTQRELTDYTTEVWELIKAAQLEAYHA